MKKILLLTFLAISIAIIIPSNLYSLDLTVGATTWYAFGSRSEDLQKESIRTNGTYSFDPTFLYGPALSVKFTDSFNLTFIYLYGKFDYDEVVYKDSGGVFHATSKAKRSDSDLALNYRLNNYFKLFAGIKYMAYEVKLSYDDPNPFRGHCENHSKHTSLGPGLGLSSTFPVTDNMFLLATLSGFYLSSSGEKFEDSKVYDPIPVDFTIAYNEYGINGTIAFAYYISSISTVISLGGRFQYFVVDYDKYKDFLINSVANKIYGITLSATYTFSI